MQRSSLFKLAFLFPFFSEALGARLPQPAARALSFPLAQPTSWSLPHRAEIGSKAAQSAVEEKQLQQGPPQIPFQYCPEFWGNAPKLCSMCGSDSNKKGTCNDLLVSGDQTGCGAKPCRGYYCQCTNDGTDNSPKVTMTSDLGDGNTATAIWEPMTLSRYANLRASITATLTETATATDKGGSVETVAAVVFAGGVAWYLASQNAAAGAVLFAPPAQLPDGAKPDDEICKNSGNKPDCDSCQGNTLEVCTSGAQSACPCEKHKCPSDDAPVSCPSQECLGDDTNLLCTVPGSLNKCRCCPSTQQECSANDCQGGNDGKCSADKYKGCACDAAEFPGATLLDGWPKSFPQLNDIINDINRAIPILWGGDIKNIPGYIPPQDQGPPYCLYGAMPNSPRQPKEYCQCGDNHATTWSALPKPTDKPSPTFNACPWNAQRTGEIVSFTSPTPTPPPKPSVDSCDYWSYPRGDDYKVMGMRNFESEGGGSLLEDAIAGCTGLTNWDWRTNNDGSHDVAFWMPTHILPHCVENAIKGVGGPDLECASHFGGDSNPPNPNPW